VGGCLIFEVPFDHLDQLGVGGNAVLVMANATVGKKLTAIADIGLILIRPPDRKFIVPREHCGPAFLGRVWPSPLAPDKITI
jgi:hypothetical protein